MIPNDELKRILTEAREQAVKTFKPNVVTVRPRRWSKNDDHLPFTEINLHELVVPVCFWWGEWRKPTAVQFGFATARWHTHLEQEGGYLLVPRAERGPDEPTFTRCKYGCVTHADWTWMDTKAAIDESFPNDQLNRLATDWVNAGNNAVYWIADRYKPFV